MNWAHNVEAAVFCLNVVRIHEQPAMDWAEIHTVGPVAFGLHVIRTHEQPATD